MDDREDLGVGWRTILKGIWGNRTAEYGPVHMYQDIIQWRLLCTSTHRSTDRVHTMLGCSSCSV